MNRIDLRLVDQVFHGALRLPAERRQRFLRDACAGSDELRAEVDSLLRFAPDADSFLEEPMSIAAEPIGERSSEPGSDLGLRVGPYRLTRVLGSGGMGTVYLGEREDDLYRGSVAVKIVRRGMDTEAVLRRSRAERQALARLAHPYIARLYDGEAVDDGRPYLIMEHVDGERIDAYCDRRRLSLHDRIRLFRKVCDAVQHAHRNLTVHRDLKPSNILVTEDGNPKLLDFGIARLLDPASDALTMTSPAARLLTPDYASPEQIRGEPVSTASDIYSLGVILYELLTGHRPHAGNGRTSRDTQSSTRCGVPERPSTVVLRDARRDTVDGGADTVSAANLGRMRRETPARLRRRLAGDLDNIVLMALREEPERRFASVDQLSANLDQYLRGLPVSARPDRWTYRAAKLVRRNKATSGVALLFVVALVAGIIGTGSQAMRAERGRSAAERASAEAEEVTRFLVDLFEGSDPRAVRVEAASSIELLDRGVRRLEHELRDRPHVRATLLDAIGGILRNLGAYDRAAPLLEEALAIRENEPGSENEALAESLSHLGELRQLEGKPREALVLLQRSHEIRKRSGASRTTLATSLNEVGVAHRTLGELDTAETMLREALRLACIDPAQMPLLVPSTRNNLAAVAIAAGRYDAAAEHARTALMEQETLLPADHPDRSASFMNLGLAEQRLGRLDEADAAFAEALRVRRAAYGAEHPLTAVAASCLGTTERALGRAADAESHLREAVSVLREVPSEHLPFLSAAQNNLAALLVSKGDLAGAESLFGEALETIGSALGKDHPHYASILNNIAFVRESRGETDTALRAYREALSIDRRRLPDGHPDLAVSLSNLARLLRSCGQSAEAAKLEDEAAAIQARAAKVE